jgi:hypothetical protein
MNNGTYEMASPMIGLFTWLFMIGLYLFFAYTQYRIAQKCGAKDNAWWSFIPIMNLVLWCQMARKPLWWTVLLFVPIVGLVVGILMSVEVARNAGHPAFWGIALIIPFLNFVALIVMAFTEGSGHKPVQHTQPAPHQRTPQSVG